jgi:hypothetical protein
LLDQIAECQNGSIDQSLGETKKVPKILDNENYSGTESFVVVHSSHNSSNYFYNSKKAQQPYQLEAIQEQMNTQRPKKVSKSPMVKGNQKHSFASGSHTNREEPTTTLHQKYQKLNKEGSSKVFKSNNNNKTEINKSRKTKADTRYKQCNKTTSNSQFNDNKENHNSSSDGGSSNYHQLVKRNYGHRQGSPSRSYFDLLTSLDNNPGVEIYEDIKNQEDEA